MDEPLIPVSDQGGFVPLESVEPPSSSIWMTFQTSFAHGPQDKRGKMTLCDYASAGNTWDAKSRFRVWPAGVRPFERAGLKPVPRFPEITA